MSEVDSPVLARVRELIVPIASDLGLDLYDLEQRGGTLRVTLDTPAGTKGGVTLDMLSLASRLVSKELDQHDPIPSRYTLEVTSPGVERPLRRPEHFQREVGKVVAIRLAGVARAEPGSSSASDRRIQGTLANADDTAVTIRLDDASERTIEYSQIDRARTVFEWGLQPKPGQSPKPRSGKPSAADATAEATAPTSSESEGEES